jgi:carbamate kinase
VLSQVVVDAADPAFASPSKPIGPFYARAELAACHARGWTMGEEPPHGWRRVVPSPEPLEIVEESVIRSLVDADVGVIALGGGGIPVVRHGQRVTGIEAVVDKDLASAVLATRLRADRLVLATDVDRIYLDFGTPDARGLGEVAAEDLRRHAEAGHFPAGTMGPKVEAALRFVHAGGGEAIVTSYDRLASALQGRAGTRVRLAAHPPTHDARHLTP